MSESFIQRSGDITKRYYWHQRVGSFIFRTCTHAQLLQNKKLLIEAQWYLTKPVHVFAPLVHSSKNGIILNGFSLRNRRQLRSAVNCNASVLITNCWGTSCAIPRGLHVKCDTFYVTFSIVISQIYEDIKHNVYLCNESATDEMEWFDYLSDRICLHSGPFCVGVQRV